MSPEERSPQGEHRSAPVLTKDTVETCRRELPKAWACDLCDSHEAMRAERDAALAEVARIKGVALAAYRLTRGNGIDGALLADLCAQLVGFKLEDFDHA